MLFHAPDCFTAQYIPSHYLTLYITFVSWYSLCVAFTSLQFQAYSTMGGFRVQPPNKWIRSCYKSLKIDKSTPDINKNSPPQVFSGYAPVLYRLLPTTHTCFLNSITDSIFDRARQKIKSAMEPGSHCPQLVPSFSKDIQRLRLSSVANATNAFTSSSNL